MNNDMYIYHLPYPEHKELCRILDRDTRWEELAGRYMKFDMMTISDLGREYLRGMSPTSVLLTMWGQQNHTVVQLFVLLSKMHHYQAMTVLKPFVDSRYHALLNEGEQNMSIVFDKEDNSTPAESSHHNENHRADEAIGGNGATAAGPLVPDKDLNVGDNLNNCDVRRDLNPPKVLLPPENPPEIKILNTPMPLGSNTRERGNNVAVPRVTVNTPSSDMLPALSPQPLQHGLRSEGKENTNPTSPVRKLSSGSIASSITEAIPQIQYSELGKATNNWDKATIIGKGGFGTVFKGNWKNTLVAVKRIEQRGAESVESHRAQMEQSLRELRVLNACRHDNILPLYGFSGDGPEPCLVYQFMPNGSLEDRILCRQGTAPLTWFQRHHIAQGTARGLQFLHGKPFVHGDIKSANILLDNNFEPRIGDFGLAREGPQNECTHKTISRVHGTLPYLPNDFLRNKKMSNKVDTYSYGIVLFELITGLRAYDDSRKDKFLIDHVKNWDEANIFQLHDRKPGLCDANMFKFLVDLGKECVQLRARDRPEMETVLERLEQHRRQLDLPPRTAPMSRVHVVCDLPTRPPEQRMVWSPSPVSPEPNFLHRPAAVPGTGMLSPSPNIPMDAAKIPIFTPEEVINSSPESSEEVGAVAMSPVAEANDDAVPLLSALGIKDPKDTKSNEDISAKGKQPLSIAFP